MENEDRIFWETFQEKDRLLDEEWKAQEERNYERALERAFRVLEIERKVNDQESVLSQFLSITSYYVRLNNIEMAEKYCEMARALRKTINNPKTLSQLAFCRYEISDATGDNEQAMKYLKEYVDLNEMYADISDLPAVYATASCIAEFHEEYEYEISLGERAIRMYESQSGTSDWHREMAGLEKEIIQEVRDRMAE